MAAWIRSTVPSRAYQRAIALPAESIAIRGAVASRPPGEIVWSPPKLPPAGRKAAWMRPLDPSTWVQTAIALPPGSKATCGPDASRPAAEIVAVGPEVPSAARNLAWMRILVPSDLVQTIRELPLEST